MANYEVKQRCFYLGKAYDKGDVLKLDDEMTVYNYRAMGYIGAEIPPAKRKGRKVKDAVNAN